MKAVIAALLATSVEANTGFGNCKCLEQPDTPLYPDADEPTKMAASVTTGEGDAAITKTYAYPGSYGYGTCTAHDATLPPSCADEEGTALADAPSWCASTWCYVDPDTCIGRSFAASAYFEKADEAPKLFYSYATCGGTNTFDNSGIDTCKCRATPSPHKYASDTDGKVVAHTGKNEDGTPIETMYPTGYGFNYCNNWDKFLPPSCAAEDGTPKADAPSWCGSKWCFVDNANCTGVKDKDGNDETPEASSYFKREGEDDVYFYSYETCGDADTFSDDGALRLAVASTMLVAAAAMI